MSEPVKPNEPIVREIFPRTRVLSESEGLVEYVASDQSLDSYREIILAEGWKFDHRFTRNPVFVDSHSYWGIDKVLGKVTDWRVEGGELIEVVKWAIDVEENALAQLGFNMTAKGYLKACSVGFVPVKWTWRGEDDFTTAVESIDGLKGEDRDAVRVIYQEQQQIELSACVIGANPSALSKAYHSGDVKESLLSRVGFDNDEKLETLELTAKVFENSDDPSVRDLARHTLRKCFSTGRSHSNRSATSTSDHGRAVGDSSNHDQEKRKAWLKKVAAEIGA